MPTSKSKLPEIVPAAEANRRFSELLRGVREEGKTFTITSHGRAVAQISAPEAEVDEGAKAAERQAARERLMARLESQPVMNSGKFNRDEAYDD